MNLTASFSARRSPRKRHGAAAVELAFAAPVLFMLVFGMLELGRGLMVQQLLISAARDGARMAILADTTASDVEAQVTSQLSASSVSGVTVIVSPDPLSSADIGDPVTVTIEVPFDSVAWLPSSRFLDGLKLDAAVTMRKESSASSTSSTESSSTTNYDD